MANQGSIEDERDLASTQDSPLELGFVGEITESSYSDSDTEPNFLLDDCFQHPTMQMDQEVMENLGKLFEPCIQRVSLQEKQRDELIQELLLLQEPMLRVVKHLRATVAQTKRLLTLAQMDHMAVYEEVQQVKRKLFTTARECIQSQVDLDAHEYEVAKSVVTQEELKAHIQKLNQELTDLKKAQKTQLKSLRDQATRCCRPRAMSDVSQCRQASVKLQRRLSGSMRALEGWYEPRLMALLRRRQAGEDALRKCREQAVDLKTSLEPLKEDIKRLELQRSCLEHRISLMEKEGAESITQHKETVERLEETLRELEVEFDIQRKSKNDLEDVKNGLLMELTFLRGCDEAAEGTAEEET